VDFKGTFVSVHFTTAYVEMEVDSIYSLPPN